jgi:hypothetical protein
MFAHLSENPSCRELEICNWKSEAADVVMDCHCVGSSVVVWEVMIFKRKGVFYFNRF